MTAKKTAYTPVFKGIFFIAFKHH